jgi:Protein of unknown function (DUF3604)
MAFVVGLAGPSAPIRAQTSAPAPAKSPAAAPAKAPAAPGPIKPNPLRDAYFGQTHSHTSRSVDAFLIGNHLTGPEEAYKYSLGQPVKHPAGFDVKTAGLPDARGARDRVGGPGSERGGRMAS